MPWRNEWVEPELFLEHAGVKVYHTYKNDDVGAGTRTYSYTLSMDCGEEDCNCPDHGECRNVFDVRELATLAAPIQPPFLTGENDTPENRKAWDAYHADRVQERAIEAAIRTAIDKGLLPKPAPVDQEPVERNA